MPEPPPAPPIIVSAGIIEREDGALLIARRPPGAWMAGYWEFPGGKLEPGETPEECLAREIREELAVDADVGPIFLVKVHAYPAFSVLLLFYRCTLLRGEPPGPAGGGLEFAWAHPETLPDYDFLPADDEVIRRLL
ncbi:MAG: (deoxy)nucleoside triphosphate pyrophosphohydrolase [Myxococcota bacterium]